MGILVAEDGGDAPDHCGMTGREGIPAPFEATTAVKLIAHAVFWSGLLGEELQGTRGGCCQKEAFEAEEACIHGVRILPEIASQCREGCGGKHDQHLSGLTEYICRIIHPRVLLIHSPIPNLLFREIKGCGDSQHGTCF